MKKLYVLLLIILATFVGFTLNSNDYSSLDTLLKSQEYTNPTASNGKGFSIIIYNPKNQSIDSIENYGINNNNSLDISIQNGDYFIISLPTYSTVTYSWKIVNALPYNSFKLLHTSSIALPLEDSEKNLPLIERKMGGGLARQNFYFSTSSIGSHSLDFELSSTAYKSTDNFKITLNINII